jgi:CO/xanthine dehydrogenase FAD-binding subunit
VRYSEFHTGYKQTLLAPGELVARIRLPRTKEKRVQLYRKIGPRKAQAISKVCLAACAELVDGRVAGVRMALGGVAPITVRTPKTERLLVESVLSDPTLLDRAVASLQEEIAPIDDVRSTLRYRREVAGNLLKQFVTLIREAA